MSREDNKNNYTAANSMPFKVLKDPDLLLSIIDDKKIIPIHIQISPTNYCNLNCDFCSCDSREKNDQLSIDELKEIVDISAKVGTKAFTVTGGGEPLLHPQINEFLRYSHDSNIELGLVSNGLAAKKLEEKIVNLFTWARISFGDFRKFDENFKNNMDYLRSAGTSVDMAFSYVVGVNPNEENIRKIIAYANENNFTHVRLVPDLYNVDKIDMPALENTLSDMDLSRCIFQNRSEYTAGKEDCNIALLKPLIASDGFVYPCCGVQYALADESQQKMFPTSMRMGHFTELEKIIGDNKPFKGSKCVKCYYNNYNEMLAGMVKDYKHGEFL